MHLIPMPLPTNHTVHGPIMLWEGGEFRLRFDHEVGGVHRWLEVTFTGVLAMQFTDFAICSADVITGSTYVVADQDVGEGLTEASRQSTAVGAASSLALTKFSIYFDDVGVLAVLARSLALGEVRAGSLVPFTS